MNRKLAILGLVLLVAGGCSSKATRTNPYDPQGTGPKAPGRISGTAWIQGATTQAGASVHILDSQAVAVDGGLVTADDGTFLSPELVPATYRVDVDVPVGNVPIRVDGVVVLPGETTDVGFLASLAEPPSGSITGQVTLDSSVVPPDDIRVTLMRTTGATVLTDEKPTSADGSYVFDALTSGPYELRASRVGFTPDRVTVAVDTAVPGATQAPPMKLYPAASVAKFVVHTAQGDIEGAPYTQSPSVDLKLLAFAGANKMRFSESADMMPGGVEEPWRDWLAQVPVTLSAGEGPKTMYVQLAVVDPDPPNTERMRTDTYTATIMLDQSPPLMMSIDFAPNAVEKNGVRYLTQGDDPSSVPIKVVAFDPYSRPTGIKYLVEGADPASTTYETYPAADTTVTFPPKTLALTPTDGVKQVQVQLVDAAGNESALFGTSVVIDTTPPLLLADPAVVVRDAVAGEIRSPFLTLQFAVGGDSANGIDGPVSMRYGMGAPPPTGIFLGFLPEVSTLISANHGDVVQFYGVFHDNAGNEVTASSPNYRVNYRGAVSGRVLIEGVPETGPNAYHDGTTVEVFAAGVDLTQPSVVPVASGTTVASGDYVVTDIPAGSYQVRFRRPGGIPIVRSPVSVSAGVTTELGTERMILARGTLTGMFQKADLGPSGNHGGITVTAFLAGKVMGSATTDETGLATLSDLPVSDAYEIKVSADNYVSVSLPSVKVVQDVIRPFNATPVGCETTPLTCDPVALQRLLGDFKICDRDDSASAPKDCSAVLYTNKTQVLLGLDAQNVTHVRYIKQNPSSPGQSSFTTPSAQPVGAAICATPPQEDCWNPYVPTTHYLATVGSLSGPAEASATVVVQFANAGPPIDIRPVGTSDIIYDRAPPTSAAITIARGVDALLDGFTNNAEVAVTASAVATTGPEDQASPLGLVRLSRNATWDGAGVNGDKEFGYAGTKLFTVDSGADGLKSIYAWICDKAANCTMAPVSATITLDRQPPTRLNGRDILPTGIGITVKDISTREWWTRSPVYSVAIDVGASPYTGVPDVLAYRMALTQNFVGSTWMLLDPATTTPNAVVNAVGVSLEPVDGDHLVFSQFMDAAGNISTAEVNADKFTLALDTVPPGGTVSLEGGADYTKNNPMTVAFTTDALDGAVGYQYSWTGVLPDPYTDTRHAYTNTPIIPAAPGGDGQKTLVVRFFDPAGNFSERSDTTFLDTTPPDANAVASCDTCTYDSAGDVFYNAASGAVTLYLFASDNSGIISRVEVVVDGNTATKRVLQYSPYVSVTVSTVVGPHSLQVTFFDPANNARVLAPFTVTLDRTQPTLTVNLDGGNSWTKDPYVDITLTAADANELEALYVSNSPTFGDAESRAFTTAIPDWLVAAPNVDGQKNVYVRVVDAAGNATDASHLINLDATPPSLTATIQGTAASGTSTTVTNTENVSINLTASDPGGGTASGLFQMQASNAADFSTGSGWVGYAATISGYTLATPGVDGDKTVYVRVKDTAGNITSVAPKITLDKTGPALGTVAFLEGAVTTTTSVTLSIGQTGATQARFTGGLTAPAPNTWMTLSPQQAVTLTGGDGSKTVTVELRDDAGNVSTPASRNAVIILDTPATGKPPTAGATVTVAGLDKDGVSSVRTRTQNVTVTLAGFADNAGGSGLVAYMLSENAGFANGTWVSCTAGNCNLVVPWTLSSGDGDKTLYAKVKDLAGNESATVSSTSIKLDTTAPILTASITGTAASGASTTLTNTETVTINLTASDPGGVTASGLSQMQTSNAADFSTGSGWVNYAASISSYTLDTPAADGEKIVYVRVRDAAGNVTAVAPRIVLDKSGPALGTVAFLEGAATTITSVTLSIGQTGGTQVRFTGNLTAPASNTWMTLSPQQAVTLSAGDGTKTVTVELRDDAGNVSTPVSRNAVIILDTPATGKPPTVGATVTVSGLDKDGASAARTRTPNVTVTLAGFADNVGGSGLVAYMLSENSGFANGTWVACPSGNCNLVVPWTLSSGDGDKTLYAKVKDLAGNESATVSSTAIKLDTTAPTLTVGVLGTTVGTNDSSQYTHTLAIQVTPTASDGGSGLSPTTNLMQVSELSNFSTGTGWTALGPLAFNLTGVDGTKWVYVKVRDLAGNETVSSASIILDRVGPYYGSVVIDSNAAYTNSTTGHTLTLSSSDGMSGVKEMRIGNVSGGGTFEAYNSTKPSYALAAGAGTQTVYVTFRDYAGNTSAEYTDSIIVDLAAPSTASFSVEAGAVDYTGVCGPAAEHWVMSSVVQLNMLTGSDDVGIVDFKVAEGGNFGAVAWYPWPGVGGTFNFALSPGNGQKSISMRVRDAVGNTFDSAAVCVSLDTVPPVNVAVAAFTDAACTIPAINNYYSGSTFYLGIAAEDEATYGSVPYIRFDNNTDVNWFFSGGTTYYDSDTVTTNHYYNNAAPLMPFASCLQGSLETASATTEILSLYARDEVGNWSTRVPITIKYDGTPPSTPNLTVAEVANQSAHLFWTAANDVQSGLQYYEIEYTMVSPSAGTPKIVRVSAPTTDYALVSDDLVAAGLPSLDNRARYQFRIRAVNNAGSASAWSAYLQNTVGWQRFTADFSNNQAIIPFGVAEYDGVIYVGYLKYEAIWIVTATTAYMAVSSDGGQSWTTSTIDDALVSGRETLGMYAGDNGVVVVGSTDRDPPPAGSMDLRMAAWRSTDQGATWSMTYLDGANHPNNQAGVGLTAQGGALVAMFERQTGYHAWAVRSYDGGATWTAPYDSYNEASSSVAAHVACNTQFNVGWAYRDSGNLYLMRSYDLGETSYLSQTVTGVTHAAITCTDPTLLSANGYAYAAYTDSGTGLNLRYNSNLAGANWSASDTVLRASGVDVLGRPGLYASGTSGTQKLFVGYRDTAGNLWVGESPTPTSAGSYVWQQTDMAGNVGVNMVMNGTAEGNPILAYTDDAGQSLYVLRSAMPAPRVQPLASEGQISVGWRNVPGATSYEVDLGATPVVVPDTSYTNTTVTSAQLVTVSSLDQYGQKGEPGTTWDIAPFVPGTIVAASAAVPGSLLSSTGRILVNGAEVLAFLPAGFPAVTANCTSVNDICFFHSTDSGATFTSQRLFSMGATAQFAKQMSLTTNASSGLRAHVAYTESYASDPDLFYEYADSPFGSWNSQYLDRTDTTPAGDATGEELQLDASGAEVVAFWVQRLNDGTNYRNIRARYSRDYGATWYPGFCVGGTNNGNACAVVGDCPSGACASRTCSGGTNNGNPCAVVGDCPGGSCPPSATTNKIYMNGAPYHCAGGANVGEPCTIAANCPSSSCVATALYSNLSIGYAPTSLTMIMHTGTQALLGWIDSNDKVQLGRVSSYASLTAGWTLHQLSASNELVNTVRGDRFGNTYVIAWIGAIYNASFPNDPSVWVYVSGSGAPTAAASGWTTLHIDTEPAVDNSLDVSVDQSGFYITYATMRVIFGVATRTLKLAYCKQECTGRDNWQVVPLRSESDTAGMNDFGGALLGVNQLNSCGGYGSQGTCNAQVGCTWIVTASGASCYAASDLFIGAGDSTGAATGSYLLERAGRFNRRR